MDNFVEEFDSKKKGQCSSSCSHKNLSYL